MGVVQNPAYASVQNKSARLAYAHLQCWSLRAYQRLELTRAYAELTRSLRGASARLRVLAWLDELESLRGLCCLSLRGETATLHHQRCLDLFSPLT